MVRLAEEELREPRWREAALIPQGAMNSLNPVMKIRDQIGDAITTHEGKQPKDVPQGAHPRIVTTVGLPAASTICTRTS